MRKFRIRFCRGIAIVEVIAYGNNKSDAIIRACRKVGEEFNYLSCEMIRK